MEPHCRRCESDKKDAENIGPLRTVAVVVVVVVTIVVVMVRMAVVVMMVVFCGGRGDAMDSLLGDLTEISYATRVFCDGHDVLPMQTCAIPFQRLDAHNRFDCALNK